MHFMHAKKEAHACCALLFTALLHHPFLENRYMDIELSICPCDGSSPTAAGILLAPFNAGGGGGVGVLLGLPLPVWAGCAGCLMRLG